MWPMIIGAAMGASGGVAGAYQARERDKAMWEAASLQIKQNILSYYNAVRSAQAEIADMGTARNEALISRASQAQAEAGFIRSASGGTGLMGNTLDRIGGAVGMRAAQDTGVINNNYDAGIRQTGLSLYGMRGATQNANLLLTAQPTAYNRWLSMFGMFSGGMSGAAAGSK